MTDRSKLLALADAVEKLTGPDRESDCLIWCHTKGIDLRWTGCRSELLDAGEEGIIGWIDPGKHQRNFQTNRATTGPGSVPAYTTSLDAAMSLVPEGCLFTARTVWNKMTPAGLGFISRYEKGEFNGHERLYWMDEHQAVAATPALALCAAALRAQAEASA